ALDLTAFFLAPRFSGPRRRAHRIMAHTSPPAKLQGPGLRFAVPRLKFSNDKTPPKSADGWEDHHADTTQIRQDAGCRRSAGHERTTGAAAAREQAHDRRRPGAFLE